MTEKYEEKCRVADGVEQLLAGQVHAEGAAEVRHCESVIDRLKTKHLVVACAACIILTYLATSYMLINYGSMFWGGGDNVEKENRIMFQQIVEGLPPDARATWDHFAAQLKKDEEATIRHIEKETKGKGDHTSTD